VYHENGLGDSMVMSALPQASVHSLVDVAPSESIACLGFSGTMAGYIALPVSPTVSLKFVSDQNKHAQQYM
jgi:hypothetical protein